MKSDILDTCENKSCQFSRVSVPKLNKKKLLPFYLLRIVVFTSTILILSSFNPPKTKPFGITRVVIDAGHGGHAGQQPPHPAWRMPVMVDMIQAVWVKSRKRRT